MRTQAPTQTARITPDQVGRTRCYEVAWPNDRLWVRSKRTANVLARMTYSEAIKSRAYRLDKVAVANGWGGGSATMTATGDHGAETCPF